jgi:hypothetical protein
LILCPFAQSHRAILRRLGLLLYHSCQEEFFNGLLTVGNADLRTLVNQREHFGLPLGLELARVVSLSLFKISISGE